MFGQIYAKLPAQDVERARSFYADKLGLSPYGEHAGHLYYEVGGSYFIVFPSTGAPSGTHDQLGLVVDDVEATVAQLRAHGVELDDARDLGRVKAAWFNDSEGNLLSVAEFVGGSPFRPRVEATTA